MGWWTGGEWDYGYVRACDLLLVCLFLRSRGSSHVFVCVFVCVFEYPYVPATSALAVCHIVTTFGDGVVADADCGRSGWVGVRLGVGRWRPHRVELHSTLVVGKTLAPPPR